MLSHSHCLVLSSQIHHAHSYASSIGITTRTKEIAKLIFERTPIIIYQMLHDDPGRRKQLKRDDKYVEKHLKVTQVRDLKMTRTFNYTKESNIEPTTSCADSKLFTIYISSSKEIDYYDIASSLCALMFTRTKTTDAMVFERHLTASLNNLKRKGIPVDRILNIHKNVELVPSPPVPPPHVNALPPPARPTMSAKDVDKYTKQVQEVFSDCQEGYIRQLITQQTQDHAQNVINKLLHEDYPKTKSLEKQVAGSVTSEEERAMQEQQQRNEQVQKERSTSGFMNRFWSTIKTTPPPTPPLVEVPTPAVEKPKLPKSDTTITPNYTSNIQQNLKRAIHSCKPYAGTDLYSPPRINEVKESSTYCDATPGQDLTYVGNVLNMEFYVHRSISAEDVLDQHGQAMSRFSSVLTDLAKVFQLPLKTIQIYYDGEGPTIAFNLSGSLFMNLRYYLALHEARNKEEEASKRKEALIYWFMTLCHELAHNFVLAHNSEHEFYMSSFAENYLEAFMSHIYN